MRITAASDVQSDVLTVLRPHFTAAAGHRTFQALQSHHFASIHYIAQQEAIQYHLCRPWRHRLSTGSLIRQRSAHLSAVILRRDARHQQVGAELS